MPATPVRSGPLTRLAPDLRAAPVALATTPAEVELRLLLVGTTGEEPSFAAASGALDRIGVPYTSFIATETTLDNAALWTETGGCRYAGVILTQSELGYEDGDGNWVSALDESEWQRLADYEVACGAREVAWYAYPGESNGLDVVAEFQSDDVISGQLSEAGAARFPYLRPDAPVELSAVWGYTGAVTAAAATTVLLQTETGEALIVVHERADGREVLAMTFDSSQWTRHAMLLEFGVIDWVSRGLFLGARRLYLTPQIDDMFIDNEIWGQPLGNYRMSVADVDFIADWQPLASARLPAGSTFITQLAFNGAGTDTELYPDGTPIAALQDRQDAFVWINHTWGHINMNSMSVERARAEITANCELAAEWDMPGFTCTAVVTPEISGLDHDAALEGMISAGVRVAVSDSSYTAAVNPDNPGDNPSFNVGRRNPLRPELYQVPRYPTNVFYNTSLPEELVSEFNYLYRDQLGVDLTYEEIIERDTEVGLRYLHSYDVNPLMFHQSNLRAFTGADSELHSLYTDWVDRLIERHTAQMTLPVLSPHLTEIAAIMQARGGYDTCGVRALRISDEAGDRIELTGAAACEVPITGLDAPDAGRVEVYAGVPTTFVALDACSTVTIPLESP